MIKNNKKNFKLENGKIISNKLVIKKVKDIYFSELLLIHVQHFFK